MGCGERPASDFRWQQALQIPKETDRKYLKKLTGKGKATNVMHITWVDPGCINAFKFGTDLPNWHAEPGLSLRD
jgi:hypothetical protein